MIQQKPSFFSAQVPRHELSFVVVIQTEMFSSRFRFLWRLAVPGAVILQGYTVFGRHP